LEKYKKEREISENLAIEVRNVQKRAAALSIEKSLIQKAAIQQIDYSNPLVSVTDKIRDFETRIDSESRRNILVEYYYIAQEFEKAYELRKDKPQSFLVKTALKLKNKKKRPEGVLFIDDFYEIIKVNHREMVEKIIVYDAALRKDFRGYDKVIKRLLSTWNKGSQKSIFEYNPAKKSLRLSGAEYKVLGSEDMASNRKCMLTPLGLEKLDIKGTRIYELKQLKGMDVLEELDIRETLVTDLRPLNNLPSLKIVRVDEDQFTKEQLSVLRESIQIKIIE